MSDPKLIIGTPTPVFLKAKRWKWQYVAGPFDIDIKLSGVMVSNTNQLIDYDTVNFNVAEDIDMHMDLGTIVKVLFTESLYPRLEENQVFSVSGFLVNKDSNTLTVVGNILEQVF